LLGRRSSSGHKIGVLRDCAGEENVKKEIGATRGQKKKKIVGGRPRPRRLVLPDVQSKRTEKTYSRNKKEEEEDQGATLGDAKTFQTGMEKGRSRCPPPEWGRCRIVDRPHRTPPTGVNAAAGSRGKKKTFLRGGEWVTVKLRPHERLKGARTLFWGPGETHWERKKSPRNEPNLFKKKGPSGQLSPKA